MMNCQFEKQSGSTLVLALICALLLMIVSFEVAHTSRIEAFIAHNIETDARLDVACRAGLERGLARLREDRQKTEIDSQQDSWYQLYVDTSLVEADVASQEFLARDEGNEYGGDDSERETRLYIETIDESSKFNIYNLLVEDDTQLRKRRENFGNLIENFRKDFDDDLTYSDGIEMAKEIEVFLRRSKDRPYHNVPKATTKQDRTLTDITELLYVQGITPDIMWDKVDEDGDEIIPGLWRFVTVWSDMRININTADEAVLSSLFSPAESSLGTRIIEFREEDATDKDRTAGRFSETRSFNSGEDNTEDPTGGAPFTQINELREKVEGINQETYNAIAPFLTVQSEVFSIIVTAERGYNRRTKMWVVRRTPQGFRILLERPVSFPYFLADKSLEEAEERSNEEQDY